MKISNSSLTDDIISKPLPLSEEQIPAVISPYQNNKVIAGAGAGKTEVLTRRIVYLLIVRNFPASSIVAFTFTEKASKNMKNRIYERVEEIAGDNATANLGEMYIGTIHGYAKRILEDHFEFSNYRVLDENQEMCMMPFTPTVNERLLKRVEAHDLV